MKQELHLPSQTYVVYLRNVSSGAGFFDGACYDFYLKRLYNSLKQYQVALHAYCLLADDGYLLVTPSTPHGLARLLKSLNVEYGDYYNSRFERSAVKNHWRWKSSLIYGENLLLDCQKLLETLPRNQGLVDHCGKHHWSSYCVNAFGIKSPWITPHREYQNFLSLNQQPLRAYRNYLEAPFPAGYMTHLLHNFHMGTPPASLPNQMIPARKIRKRLFNCDQQLH